MFEFSILSYLKEWIFGTRFLIKSRIHTKYTSLFLKFVQKENLTLLNNISYIMVATPTIFIYYYVIAI